MLTSERIFTQEFVFSVWTARRWEPTSGNGPLQLRVASDLDRRGKRE